MFNKISQTHYSMQCNTCEWLLLNKLILGQVESDEITRCKISVTFLFLCRCWYESRHQITRKVENEISEKIIKDDG